MGSVCFVLLLRWFNPGLVGSIEKDAMFTSFSFLVSMLIAFRTSQAYSRFWDGTTLVHQMLGDWFDAASTVIAFTKHSRSSVESIMTFQQTLVRLVSILSAMILAELEGCDDEKSVNAWHFDLLDADSLEQKFLVRLREADRRPEVVFQWIQNLIVENISTRVLDIPPPLLTRTFQDLGSGMIHYHDALKYADTPFPFPYTAATDILLIIHWFVTPIVICSWTERVEWALIFTFVTIFVIWSLHFIAGEIENPFGDDLNDLNMGEMQQSVNQGLCALVSRTTQETPFLRVAAITAQSRLANGKGLSRASVALSFHDLAKKSFENRTSEDFSNGSAHECEARTAELDAAAPADPLKRDPEEACSLSSWAASSAEAMHGPPDTEPPDL
eukprot:CAMPEP_0194539700 /NCGR_PEP_ID=MMETSP0253-20130528/79723_1 /TAXON_ID=2966 /ORGANISM="Noctiluca scintillans" /LENGTH=385 /DNA_ID=CAMNT_0039386003 /DNA_START=91 /DNA_END=1245 /DNA_ORIENTATION=+